MNFMKKFLIAAVAAFTLSVVAPQKACANPQGYFHSGKNYYGVIFYDDETGQVLGGWRVIYGRMENFVNGEWVCAPK